LKIADYKVQGGKMLKIKLTDKARIIDSITILGDFFLHPESTIEDIEKRLRGCRIETSLIASEIQDVLDKNNAVLIGASPLDIALAIEKASMSN
jgi:hypothetical protein